MAALMKEAEQVLRAGGSIRFTWKTCYRELVSADGTAVPLDGRTYQALLKMDLSKREIGSREDETLVIEFRL